MRPLNTKLHTPRALEEDTTRPGRRQLPGIQGFPKLQSWETHGGLPVTMGRPHRTLRYSVDIPEKPDLRSGAILVLE